MPGTIMGEGNARKRRGTLLALRVQVEHRSAGNGHWKFGKKYMKREEGYWL